MITNLSVYRFVSAAIREYMAEGYTLYYDAAQRDIGADIFLRHSDGRVVVVQLKTRSLSMNRTEGPGVKGSTPERETLNMRRDILWLPVLDMASVAEIDDRLNDCRIILSQSFEQGLDALRSSALLLAYAALEAVSLRLVSAVQIPPLDDYSFGARLQLMREQSLIDALDYERLSAAATVRNYFAHGRLGLDGVAAEDVRTVIELAARLNHSPISIAVDLINQALNEFPSPLTVDAEELEYEAFRRLGADDMEVTRYVAEILRSLR